MLTFPFKLVFFVSCCRVVAGAVGGCARCAAGVRPNEGRSDSVRLAGASTELLDEGRGRVVLCLRSDGSEEV